MASEARDWNARYAEGNTPWNTGQVSRELQRVMSEYSIAPCRTLEVGCGTGMNAVYLAQQGFEVSAFDVSPLAIEQARARAAEAGVQVNFFVGDALALSDLGGPFGFVFDRGVYHALRIERLAAYLRTLTNQTAPGAYYLTLAGNANEAAPADQGPPRVSEIDLVREFGGKFELVQLREFRFDAVLLGEPFTPLGWSALWRRRN